MLIRRDEFSKPEILNNAPILLESCLFASLQECINYKAARNNGIAGKMIRIDPIGRIKIEYTFYFHGIVL